MAAMTTDVPGLEPTRGLWPVSKKPEDAEKDEFVRLVWRELTPDAFTTINSFEEWFKKTLVPRTIESLGGPQVGRMLIDLTFNHGGLKHFMQWVTTKFTTCKSPEDMARVDCVNDEPKKAPSRGLYPVTRKPSEDSETKAVFVPLVWDQISNNGVFSNIAEFNEWYKKIVRNIVSEFGKDPILGLTAIEAAFGGIKHFMTWVMQKFTTTTSPGVAAAAAQRRRARRQLRKKQRKLRKKALAAAAAAHRAAAGNGSPTISIRVLKDEEQESSMPLLSLNGRCLFINGDDDSYDSMPELESCSDDDGPSDDVAVSAGGEGNDEGGRA